MSRSILWIGNGLLFGVSCAAGSEFYRIQRAGTKTCQTCLAPVNKNGIWSGEKEPRSYSFAYGISPREWQYKERMERRRKCFGCKKSLDPTSVIVLDRSWHRKCVKCAACEKSIAGPRFYMLNNQIFDKNCFHRARENPRLKRSNTAIVDIRYPSPLTSDDIKAANSSSSSASNNSSSHDQQSRLQQFHRSHGPPKLTRNYSISSARDSAKILDEPGKMSQEMKRKLASDLLSTLNALRVREWRKKTDEAEPTNESAGGSDRKSMPKIASSTEFSPSLDD